MKSFLPRSLPSTLPSHSFPVEQPPQDRRLYWVDEFHMTGLVLRIKTKKFHLAYIIFRAQVFVLNRISSSSPQLTIVLLLRGVTKTCFPEGLN